MTKHKYKIAHVSNQDGWISIYDTSDDSPNYDAESFAELLKLFQKKCNGTIKDIGNMQYEIENLPVQIIFQWDSCFGSVIIIKNLKKLDDVVEFIAKVIE